MKQFVLGIGAQKAGTTWLYKYLSSDPDFRQGVVKDKELHIWDIREIPALAGFRRKLRRVRSLSDYYLWRMEKSEEFYFRYFETLLADGGMAADITPSYSGLSAATLRRIRERFEASGIAFRCIFFMRDPVGRCVSSFGMNRTRVRPGGVRDGVRSEGDLNEAFLAYVKSEHCRFRTRYEITLANAREAFSDDTFKALLFEEMFDEDRLKALSGFLDIGYRPGFVRKRANVARKSYDLDEAVLKECALYYRPTYEAVAELFPATAELWRGTAWLK